MKKITKRKLKLSIACILVLTSIMTSGISTRAAVYGIGAENDGIYKMLANQKEALDNSNQKIYEGTLEDYEVPENKIQIMSGNTSLKASHGKSVTVNWTVPNNKTYASNSFSLSKGDWVAIALAIGPSGKEIMTGIAHSSGTTLYTKGKDQIGIVFEAPKAGNYRVFITNHSGTKVGVTGGYGY